MTFPVLLTKLAIPRPPTQMVERLPLWGRLNAALEQQHRVILLCAPAGFGKSTMLSTWIEHQQIGPVAWLSLESQDNHLDQFLTYLHAAVTRIYPQLDLAPAFSPMLQGENAYRVFFTTLINALTSESRPLIVILDDYHVLTDQLIHSAVTFLIDHLPPTMHLIITTRVDPPLPLARLRVRRQLTELRAADLRFSRDEMRRLFTLLLHEPPSDGLLTLLERRTEGWAAGLHLAALGLQEHEPAALERLAQPLSLTQRYIFDYLADEVFAHQPPETQAFLLQTAILRRLCGPLCDAVTGRVGGADMLRLLERNNLFLTRLDDQGEWYRYHQLFADFLCRRLEQSRTADEVAALQRRASLWFEQQGVREEAIHHGLEGKDWARVILLFPSPAQINEVFQRPSVFRGWIEALPPAQQATPPVQVLYCWALAMSGELVRARQLIPQVAARMLPEHGPVLRGTLWVLDAFLSTLTGAPEYAVERLQEVLGLLTTGEHWLRMLAVGYLSSGYLILSQIRRAAAVLEEAQSYHGDVDPATMAIVTSAQAHVALSQANLDLADVLSGEVRRQAVRVSFIAVPYACLIGGLVAYERNDLTRAEAMVREGISSVTLVGRARYWPGLPLLLARVLDLRGEVGRADMLLDEALGLARQLNNVGAIVDVQVYRIERWLKQGALEPALWERAHLEELLAARPRSARPRLFLIMVGARLLLAQQRAGDPAAPLLDVLEQLKQYNDEASADGHLDHSIKLLALRALLYAALQQPTVALALLGQALDLAAPRGYRRSLLDLGEPMAQLLTQPDALALAPDFVQELRGAFHGGGRSDLVNPLPMPRLLSEREQEILRLIAQGRSVREIAELLVISLHTTRTHLKNIYAKLDAHTRLEAVERARSLRLIEGPPFNG